MCIEAILGIMDYYCSIQQYEQAIAHLKKYASNPSSKHRPAFGILHLRLGDLYLALKKYKEARSEYDIALKIYGTCSAARRGIEILEAALGQSDTTSGAITYH